MNIDISEPDLILIVEALNVYRYAAEDNKEDSVGYPYYSIKHVEKIRDQINSKLLCWTKLDKNGENTILSVVRDMFKIIDDPAISQDDKDMAMTTLREALK